MPNKNNESAAVLEEPADMKKILNELQEAKNRIKELESKNVDERMSKLEKGIRSNRSKIGHLKKNDETIKGNTDSKNKDENLFIVSDHEKNYLADIVKIRSNYSTDEYVVNKALNKLTQLSLENESKILDPIVDLGIASEIKEVTKMMGHKKVSRLRKKIYSLGYAGALNDIFNEHRTKGRNADALEDLVKDTYGLTQKVMTNLESLNGPVFMFCEELYEQSVSKNKLDLTCEVRNQVVAKLCSSI